eukprot:CAMPEP_0201994544 /NCGR_PEP_ID=MMETSP0905-20130828/2346_1 /ASSEMBLY_ACC=CAM_ASM_000554 /TAXON_ID=420261 /ORGANISM="Thalassiosira antarctica, Strain CCMP982" /LENGTH=229 /DNA_ID=CAMNT_0048549531 /DNA_START=167 /DNA_END=856 /DNA_ORIENTATION=-
MMKFTSALTLLCASQASMAAEHDKDSNKAPARLSFHITRKFVGETHLRGADKDALVATDEASEESQNTAQQWLTAHNTRRKFYQEDYGVSYRPLKWSVGLRELADDWAEDLARNCQNRAPTSEYGVNSQRHESGVVPPAEETLQLWENKLGKGYPANQVMTQVLWRATEYVGCSSETESSGSGTCTFSVCYYAKPGNCGMGQFHGENWEEPTYADDSGCTPNCPPEGCN